MESNFQQAFVTTISGIGRFAHSAYQNQKQQNKIKEEKNIKSKIYQDIAILESKITNHLKYIKQNEVIAQKAISNLEIEKQILNTDLVSLRDSRPNLSCNKSNYMKFLVQLLSKLNSISKEIKKLNKFKIKNFRKKISEKSKDTYELDKNRKLIQNGGKQYQQQCQNYKKNKSIIDLDSMYYKAIKDELALRKKLKSLDLNNELIKQNVKQFNLKKIKKIKIFNKKVQQISKKQKQKEQQEYNRYMQNKKNQIKLIKNDISQQIFDSSRQNNKTQSIRTIVQKNKSLLQQEFQNKIKKIIEKHKEERIIKDQKLPNRSSVQISWMDRYKQKNEQNRKIREAKDFSNKLEKMIKKEQKIKQIEQLVRIKTCKQLKRHELRDQKMQQINETDIYDKKIKKVLQKKQVLLKNLSDYMRNKTGDKMQKSLKIQQQNYLSYNEKIEQKYEKYLNRRQKMIEIQKKNEKLKQEQIYENYRITWNKLKIADQNIKLKQLTDTALMKKLQNLQKNKLSQNS